MVGHIPQAPYSDLKSLLPTQEMCIPSYCAKYIDMSVEFADLIVGHLFGHTHHDYVCWTIASRPLFASWYFALLPHFLLEWCVPLNP